MKSVLEDFSDLAPRISEVDVKNPDSIKLRMSVNGDLVLLLVGREKFSHRVRRFLQHYPEVHRRYPAATGFDLQLDDRITVMNGVNE
jgi:hypothetical protein